MSGQPFKIYNASAGSGKTHTLTREYLKIVLSAPHLYGQILAITFTNKAVNEMKQRILGSLYQFSMVQGIEEAPPLFKDLMNALELDWQPLRNRAKKTLKDILHNYGHFDISTIDKFTHRLIRTFAKDLKLAQNFEVVLDSDLLLAEAVDKLLEKVGREDALTKVLLEFALEKINEDKSWDISFDLNKIGRLLFDESNVSHLKPLRDKEIDRFLILKKSLASKIRQLEIETSSAAKEALDTISESGMDVTDFSRETLPNHFKKILGGEFDATKLYNNKLEENLKEGKVLKSGVDRTNDELIPQLHKLYLTAKSNIYQRAFINNVLHQIVPLALLNAIQREVHAIQEERSQLLISEFNTIISNEIKNQPAPFIYERLGEKYRHYFIDEFQDTSALQWNNMVPLIGNALEGEDHQGNRGSLFLVGDAKQAIYRWRGGKAEQFLSLIANTSNPFVVPPVTLDLPSNYRSHEEIIAFNNAFFTSSSPLLNNLEYAALFKQGNQQKSNGKKGGYVQLAFLEDESDVDFEQRYCDEVLNSISQLLDKGYPYSDIAILVRDNKHGVLLADYLTAREIPVISPDALLINADTRVQFLVGLLHFSVDQEDLELAFDLLYYLAKDKKHKHDLIEDHLKDPNAYIKRAYGFDLSIFKHQSVYDGLEQAIEKFGLSVGSTGHLMFFLDVVHEVEQKEGAGIHTFLGYWQAKHGKKSIAAPQDLNAIQIMSIHKSKGLEFPAVIFPFANSHIYKEIEPKLWLSVDSSEFCGFKEVLISKKKENIDYGPQAAKAYENEQFKLELDAFNILYVALTRAVKALFIISQKPKSTRKPEKPRYYSDLFVHYLNECNLWNDTDLIYTFGGLERIGPDKGNETEKREIPFQSTQKDGPAFSLMAKSGGLWGTEKEEALKKGDLIHYVMGLINTASDVEMAFEHIVQEGMIDHEDVSTVKEKVYELINHKDLKTYFDSGTLIKNEKDIMTKSGEIVRPDRVVIVDNEATIIDYKTGKESSQHKTQINTYAHAIEDMGMQINQKILVYINKEISIQYI